MFHYSMGLDVAILSSFYRWERTYIRVLLYWQKNFMIYYLGAYGNLKFVEEVLIDAVIFVLFAGLNG